MARQAAELLKQQDALIAHAMALSSSQQPGSGKKGDATRDNRDKTQEFGAAGAGAGADPNPKPTNADLAAQQHAVAEQTRAAAAAAQGKGGAANNSKLKDAADKTAAAAKTMEEAARAFAAGNTAAGQAKANDAKATLQEINASLQNTDRDKLEAAISDAARQASVLLDKQRDLGAETQALAKDLGTNKPDQRQQRDLQKQAYQQTVLGADAEALNNVINDLNEKADQVGQPEAIRTLSDAQKAVKRGQPQIKMSNAVVDLNTASPGSADGEQQNAEASLQKILESLQAGSDALAASREAQLNRASRAAQDAKKSLAALAAKNGGTQAGHRRALNRNAARSTAGDASGYPTRNAARPAAGNSSRYSARNATGPAAGNSSGHPTRNATGSTAGDASGHSAWNATRSAAGNSSGHPARNASGSTAGDSGRHPARNAREQQRWWG